MVRATGFVFSYDMNSFLLRMEDNNVLHGVRGLIHPEQDKWPHFGMGRVFDEEVGLSIPAKSWHCFHAETYTRRELDTELFFVHIGDIWQKFGTLSVMPLMTSGDVRIFTREDIHWNPYPLIGSSVRYLLAMIRTHVLLNDLLNLDPQQINSLCPA